MLNHYVWEIGTTDDPHLGRAIGWVFVAPSAPNNVRN